MSPTLVYSKLLEQVSSRTMLPESTVRLVLDAAVDTIVSSIIAGYTVRIQNFGRFRLGMKPLKGKPGYRIVFKIHQAVKERLNKEVPVMSMNKYSVVLDGDKSLQAKLTKQCPDCGEKLSFVEPPECPKCGTKPFEPVPPATEG